MKRIDIAIPTLDRKAKMTVCVDSLLAGDYQNISVYILCTVQAELIGYKEQYKSDDRVKVEMTDYSKVSTCWNNFVAQSLKGKSEYLLFLCDDTFLNKDCLTNAVKVMEEKFPDGDGVIGLYVDNYPPSWPEAITQYGFRLVGRKFHERYPCDMAYCPEYYRFYVDTEMGEYSKYLGRFAFAKDARMQHFHPNAPGGTLDKTHEANRGEKQQWDNEIWKARQARDLLWGKNFGTVGIR